MNIDQNNFFREAVLRICRNLDFEVALRECLRYLKSYMPADLFHLNIYDRGLGAIRNIAMATETEARRCNVIIPFDEAGRRYLEKIEPRSTFIIDQPDTEILGKSMSRMEGIRPEHSVMVTHLSVQGIRPGILVIYAEGNGRYTEEHRQLYAMLNEPFTIALSNSLRYEELSRLKDTLTDDLQYIHQRLLNTNDNTIVGENLGLKNVVERALILNQNDPLTFNEIVWADTDNRRHMPESEEAVFPSLDFVIVRHIRRALKAANGKVHGPGGAAEILGVNPSTLRHRMRKLGLYHGKRSSY